MRYFCASNELVATVALARNFVGLLHSTVAERSNETIKPATVFQNSTEKITKATKLCVFCCFPLHNWLLLWWVGGNSPPSHPLITEGLPNAVWQPLSTRTNIAVGVYVNKTETNWLTVTRKVKRFLCAFPIHGIRVLSMITHSRSPFLCSIPPFHSTDCRQPYNAMYFWNYHEYKLRKCVLQTGYI